MRPVLIVIGAVIAFFGLVGLVFGLEISDIERGQTQAICGAVALTGGFLIIAAGLVLGRLKEISDRLAALSRLPADATARVPARPPVSRPAEIFGDASRAWQDEAAAAEEAPVPAAAPSQAPEPAEPASTIPGRLSAFSRPRTLRKPAATTAATAAEVAAAAVAAAISLPEAGLAENLVERPEPEAMPDAEPATSVASEPAAAPAAEASEAPAPVGGLWKLKQTSRTFERFSFGQRPEGPAEPIPAAAGEPAQAAPSTDLPAEPAELVAAAAPGADPAARSRFPMRTMTLPRGNWPDPPARGETGVAAEAMTPPGVEETAEGDHAEAPVQAAAPAAMEETSPRDFDAPVQAGAADVEANTEAQDDAGPAHEAEPEPDAREEAPSTAPELEVIGRYESNGATYVMYADGSIDAETETGVWRFGSLDELKAYIEAQAG